MIKARNIFHYYKQDRALDGIDLDIDKESFVALVGESGSGKSTLLSVLSTLLKPSEGSLVLDNIYVDKINNIDMFRREKIGFVFQFHHLISHLTIYENIELAVLPEFKKNISSTLEMLGILKLADRYPGEISGGERQRGAIARAIINKPRIIFADEPTGNLDSRNSHNVYEILRSICSSGSTIVVATHEASLAKYADKTVKMLDGKIVDINS